jgi:GTPase involved in cell partitioning and DNA repair
MENDIMKVIESGGIVALLVVGLIGSFKISRTLYEGRMQDLKESKLNRQHIDLVCDKIDGAISEIKTSKDAIVTELQKQHLISESNSTNQQAMIKMLEQLANTKLDKIENDLIEVKNSTRNTQSILQGIRSAQLARKQENIRLRSDI